MHRYVALVLALLIPLQFAWSAAAALCGHEPARAETRHFGHHEHAHETDAKEVAGGQLAIDNDCGVCHATCSLLAGTDACNPATPVAVVRVIVPTDDMHRSAPARAPDRPQWPRLA